jgi:uncharacterized RDD family membrane protein YckC
MKKYKVVTPDNIEVEYMLANLGSRAAATVLDMLIQALVKAVIIFSALYYLYKMASGDLNVMMEESIGWIIGIVILVNFVIAYGYFILFEMRMNGATPGKKVLKLRTIRKNGQPITLKHSIIRNVFRVFIDDVGPGVFTILFTKNHQRIGDMLASTIVVLEGETHIDEILSFEENAFKTYKYTISQNEYDMTKEFFSKSLSDENREKIQNKIVKYFLEKFEIENLEESKEDFLKEVMNGLIKD